MLSVLHDGVVAIFMPLPLNLLSLLLSVSTTVVAVAGVEVSARKPTEAVHPSNSDRSLHTEGCIVTRFILVN